MPKFTYHTALLFHIYPSKVHYFDTLRSNVHNNSKLHESLILAIIRERQIFRGKYAPVEHE